MNSDPRALPQQVPPCDGLGSSRRLHGTQACAPKPLGVALSRCRGWKYRYFSGHSLHLPPKLSVATKLTLTRQKGAAFPLPLPSVRCRVLGVPLLLSPSAAPPLLACPINLLHIPPTQICTLLSIQSLLFKVLKQKHSYRISWQEVPHTQQSLRAALIDSFLPNTKTGHARRANSRTRPFLNSTEQDKPASLAFTLS